MPHPESWSSDWRTRGFSASISSCRIEAGSAATQPKTRHMTATGYRGRISRRTPLVDRGGTRATAEANLVGAAAKAVRPGAAGGRGPQPPGRPASGGDRVAARAGGAARRVGDALAAQPGGIRGGGAGLAPRAAPASRGRPSGARGGAAAAAPRAEVGGRGGAARRRLHGLRRGSLRGASARGARHRAGRGIDARRAGGTDGDAGGLRSGRRGRGGG